MLSRFPTVMQSAVEAVIKTADALRYVRNTSGDLTWRSIDAIQEGLRESKITTYATFAEAAKQPASSEAYMASMGGPQTLTDYQAKAAGIEIAAHNWNAFLRTWVASIPHEMLIGVVTASVNGIETKHIERPAFVGAEHAMSLRASPELQALIEAFEAVGAR